MRYVLFFITLIFILGCAVEQPSVAEEPTVEAPVVQNVAIEEPAEEVLEQVPQEEVKAVEETELIPEQEPPVEEIKKSAKTKEFIMTAKRWNFEPPSITVNKGDTVRLKISSVDVTHGFALLDFDIIERLSPGKTVEVEFVADKTGTFSFFCSVPCGAGHSKMSGTLIVK